MSDRISNKRRLQQPCQTRSTEKHSAVLAALELYNPMRQVLLELSDMPEEPTETRCKATSLYSVMKQVLHSTLYFRACYGYRDVNSKKKFYEQRWFSKTFIKKHVF